MSAPRPAVAHLAAPRRADDRRRADARPRTHLQVVTAPRRTPLPLVAAALVLVFGVLLGTAALNTVLVSGQRDLDRMEREITAGRRRNQALHLEQAELESPTRVVEEARRDGMVIPEEVTWITPTPDGGSDAATTPRASVPDDDGDEGDGGAPVDERADADPGPP